MNADYDYLMKLIVAGNSGAGKSSLLLQYVDKAFEEVFLSTIGVDFKFKYHTLSSGKLAKLQLWDTAGQDRFRTIVSSYWRNADGVVFVFDLSDEESFKSVKTWSEDVDKHARRTVQKILVGNKSDLTSERKISKETAQQLARAMNMTYFETSARTGQNVREAFEELAELVALDYQSRHHIVLPKKEKGEDKRNPLKRLERSQEEEEEEEHRGCCTLM